MCIEYLLYKSVSLKTALGGIAVLVLVYYNSSLLLSLC